MEPGTTANQQTGNMDIDTIDIQQTFMTAALTLTLAWSIARIGT